MAIWQTVILRESHMVAENVMALSFDAPDFAQFKSGQHVDVRLTAPNGYQAERSYSLANSPETVREVELGVQLLSDGEVSPYLFQLKPGQQIELRGPVGGHFVWDISMPGPLILIGGGSGMVPLVSMLRHHNAQTVDRGRDIFFLISSRNIERVLYREELEELKKKDAAFSSAITFTDVSPTGWDGYTRRIDKEMLEECFGQFLGKMPMIFVCGPTPFVEVVSKDLLTLGFNSHEIKTERFGGT